MEINKIYNEDCLKTMKYHIDNNSVDVILTSPPYNISRVKASDMYNKRYESYNDLKTDKEYTGFIISCFNLFSSVLANNGVVLWNASYSSENTALLWNVISDIQRHTDFVVTDCICWKKKSAIPNNRSSNKLTRICEFIFVLCRKEEQDSFRMNKKIVSSSIVGQKNYENVFNFIEASNNDGACSLNKATFSSELVRKLLRMYAKEGMVVYDPFMGTGTTAIGCIKEKMNFIGSELSSAQCEYANKRIKTELQQLTLF